MISNLRRSWIMILDIWNSYICTAVLFITWMVYLDPTYWPAPRWLVSPVGRALHWYCRGHGFKSRTGLKIFSGLISTTSSAVFLAVKILNVKQILLVSTFDIVWRSVWRIYRLMLRCEGSKPLPSCSLMPNSPQGHSSRNVQQGFSL